MAAISREQRGRTKLVR